MSTYSKILKEYIEKSKLSLSEIETELRRKGFNKNKSYISNLQNGKVEPPSPEVSLALAEITGGDAVRLASTPFLEAIIHENVSAQELIELFWSFLATFVDLNRDIFYEFANYLNIFDESIDRDEFINFFDYDLIRGGFGQIPHEEIMQIIMPNVKQSEVDTSEDKFLNLTSDEKEYLAESLQVYRKMKLKPDKDQLV